MSESKTTKLTIARAEEEDRDVIMALAKKDHEESIFGEIPFSVQKFNTFFDKSLTEPEMCVTLKATIAGRIVGFLYCSVGGYFIGEGASIASINVIYVDSEARSTILGGKIAVKLVRSISKWAKAKNINVVLFYVTSGTSIANTDRFFRKMGFTTLGGNYGLRM